ncbi:unnamed protein product [Durusdinium trenchii]|uniref:Uncharacterized protein n=1 Tax=Durusdinium trenchii TaxID=1381693 RepID=A0ABP0LNC5_9DINO
MCFGHDVTCLQLTIRSKKEHACNIDRLRLYVKSWISQRSAAGVSPVRPWVVAGLPVLLRKAKAPVLRVPRESEALADEPGEAKVLSKNEGTGERWKGCKVGPSAVSVGIGLFIRYVLPIPTGVSQQGWSMLALFVATVAGIVTRPLPSPGVAFCAFAVGLATHTLSFQDGVKAFTDEVLWLVVLAFFFTKGFAKTGLGERIALSIVRVLGGTTLGLAYGLNLAEGVLAAGMPSSAARAAGIFYPLVDAVAKACSGGKKDSTGGFLIQSAFQATGNSSSLWLYGAATNLLMLRLAAELGYVVNAPFTSWLKASCVPALAAMVLTPLVAFVAMPPKVKRTPEAPKEAKKKLRAMGPMSKDELILVSVILGMLTLWAGSSSFGIPAVHTAVMGLSVLLATGVLSWSDCAREEGAWTTMTWFGILVSMSGMLNKLGVVRWLATELSLKITALGLFRGEAFLLLLLLYILLHYIFASQAAHISALYLPFVAMMVDTGTPPMAAVFSLAFASNLFGSITPYSSAQAPVFFGGGYVSLKDWYRLGLVFIIFNIIIWVGVGSLWWKVIGIY